MRSLNTRFDVPAQSMIFIVDDEEDIRRSLGRLFRSASLPSTSFATGQEFLQRPVHDGPSCLVLDVRMPGLNGLQLQQALAERKEQIVFLTGCGDVPMCASAMRAGAVDFLVKPVEDHTLLAAVSRALVRSDQLRHAAAERAGARVRLQALTPREFEVMRFVIAGRLNKQIAAELGTAEKTVKIHRGRMMEKMRVTSVAELVCAAQAAGVTPVSSFS